MKTLVKGQLVTLVPEYQDNNEIPMWVTMDDEERGRISISPLNSGLNFPPIQTVTTDMLQLPTTGELIIHSYVSGFLSYVQATSLIKDLASDYNLELYFAYQLKEGV